MRKLTLLSCSHWRTCHFVLGRVEPDQGNRYHVDRQKSIDVLRDFVGRKERLVDEEVVWARTAGVDCILSDAAFLAW